jgi:hypothetical protein
VQRLPCLSRSHALDRHEQVQICQSLGLQLLLQETTIVNEAQCN